MTWYVKFLIGFGAVFMLFFISIFATVNYEDAVIKANWVSASGLSHPSLGSLYELGDDGIHGRPICHLIIPDDKLVGMGMTGKYEFTNVVGDMMPFLAKLGGFLLSKDVPEYISKSFRPFSLVLEVDEIYVSSFKKAPMETECEEDFNEALNTGSIISTVDRTIVAPNDYKTVYAIGFRKTCATKCPKGEKGCEPPSFLQENMFSWASILKKKFGLVHMSRESTRE